MAKLDTSQTFPGKNADQCYAAFNSAFTRAGFQVGRERPLGWLTLATRKDQAGEIQANLSARPGNPAAITLNLSSSVHDQSELSKLADAIWQELHKLLA